MINISIQELTRMNPFLVPDIRFNNKSSFVEFYKSQNQHNNSNINITNFDEIKNINTSDIIKFKANVFEIDYFELGFNENHNNGSLYFLEDLIRNHINHINKYISNMGYEICSGDIIKINYLSTKCKTSEFLIWNNGCEMLDNIPEIFEISDYQYFDMFYWTKTNCFLSFMVKFGKEIMNDLVYYLYQENNIWYSYFYIHKNKYRISIKNCKENKEGVIKFIKDSRFIFFDQSNNFYIMGRKHENNKMKLSKCEIHF